MLLSARQPTLFSTSSPTEPSSSQTRRPTRTSSIDLSRPATSTSTYDPTQSGFISAPQPPLSPSSKTAAFFSSPSPSPQPPPHPDLPPLSHPASLRPGFPSHSSSSSVRSLTIDFFASPPVRPTPPASLRSVSSSTSLSSRTDSESSVDTPDDVNLSLSTVHAHASTDAAAASSSGSKPKTEAFFGSPASSPPSSQSVRSLTADFFATSPPRPTPPPSLRSVPSTSSLSSLRSVPEDATPKPPSALPPLARLFPSRYGSRRRDDDDDVLSDISARSRSPRRGFVDLDETTMSPSSAEFCITSPPTSPARRNNSGTTHHNSSSSDYNRSSKDVFSREYDRELDDPPAPELRPGSVLRHDGRSFALQAVIGTGAFSHVWRATATSTGSSSSAVAVKVLTRRGAHGRQARAERAAFQREVDVLRQLPPHASLPALHAAFSMPGGADVLVLEFAGGGELLDLVNEDEAHARVDEAVLRRMWAELAGVVAWLHERNVVHRDIKLENVLLTTRFPTLPPHPQPLLKLTDFGLARAIDPSDPWLRTRCGSETYGAPELLLASSSPDADDEDALATYTHLSRAPTDGGRHRVSRIGAGAGAGSDGVKVTVKPRPEGAYDGRETDAWALGVVLFALATRRMPFDPPVDVDVPGRGHAAEVERRAWVKRVLAGEVQWPAGEGGLAGIEGVRSVVGRLLVRDPARRAGVAEVVGGW